MGESVSKLNERTARFCARMFVQFFCLSAKGERHLNINDRKERRLPFFTVVSSVELDFT
jgi:hypothetical protein